MEKQKELLTTFYQNISYGIFEVLIHFDKETIDNTNDIIKAIFELLFIEAYQEKYSFFLKNITQGLQYNIVLLSKMNLTTNLIKAVYYKHKEYIKGLESTEVPLPLEILTKIEAINDKFDRLFSIRRNKNAAIMEGLKNLLFEIKNNLKDAKIDQFDIGRRIEESRLMVFISHNSLDKPLARKISSELERFGIITWLDEKDIPAGRSIPEEITKALENCTHFILIYSNNSKDKPWVQTELNNIIMRRNSSKERAPTIIPLLLDDLLPPRLISDIKGIDFSSYSIGSRQLYAAFGIKEKRILSLTEVFKLLRKASKVYESIDWCFHADFFMSIDFDIFWDIVECEDFINTFPLKPDHFDEKYFAFDSITYSRDEMYPSFDDEFYIFDRSGKFGLYVVEKYTQILKRILDLFQ